jgi:sensor histidine kinase YesM
LASVFARVAVATTIWLVLPILAGVATYNLTRSSVALRILFTGFIIGAVTWCAQTGAFQVDAAVYASIYDRAPRLIGFWAMNSAFATFATGLLIYIARADNLARAFEREELRLADVERALGEARLQATQAQIEPHFLFNTLANVRWLYQSDPARARVMVQEFARVLISALPDMRDTRSTLGKELSLAVAYLSVQKIRMGERLEFETSVADALRDAELPPLMLSTLVENAVKHGLAPLACGGHIRISAERRGDALRVVVTDTGRGLAESSGSGVGLANTEVRLAAMYGAAASLDLQDNCAGGVTAIIELPLRILCVPHDAHATA